MNKAKAFIFGYVYALGYVYGLKLKITNDEEIEFRKTKDNQTIAIKNHKVVGGADLLLDLISYRHLNILVSQKKLKTYQLQNALLSI